MHELAKEAERLLTENIMSLIGAILVLVIIGLLLYVINNYVPMDTKIKSLLNIFVVVVLIIWLLQELGVLRPLHDVWIR